MATERAEAAARVAAIQAQATAALVTERTRAAAEAADLRATNDRLLAQVAAAEQRANERELAQRAAEWESVSQEAALTSSGDHAQQVQWLAAQMREMQMATLHMQT